MKGTLPIDSAQQQTDSIVVTGMGVISAAGRGSEALWQAALEGESLLKDGVARVEDSNLVHPYRYFNKLSRATQMALVAATEAWESAGLNRNNNQTEQDRIGLMAGTSRAANDLICQVTARVMNLTSDSSSRLRIRPSEALHTAVASMSGALCQFLEIEGPAQTVSATCASSTAAIALAADQILLGHADVMIAGGAEAPLGAGVRELFEAAGILADPVDSENLCRAFDRRRSGSALGEAAAFLVLEKESHALRRGAQPLIRLQGWITGMEPAGRAAVDDSGQAIEKLIAALLRRSGWDEQDIDLIHAHGTGTRMNDLAESRAFRKLWSVDGGSGAINDNVLTEKSLPWIQSTKALTGHTLGASGALESCLTIQMLRHQILPPAIHFSEIDPECGIELNNKMLSHLPLQRALKVSLGFWGHQAALAFWKEVGP